MKEHYWKWPQEEYKNLFDWFRNRNERFGVFSPESLINDSNPNIFKPSQMLLVYRIFSCMTREEFAKKFDISPHLIWQLESGNYENVKIIKTTKKYINILKNILKNNSFSFIEFEKSLDKIKTKIKNKQSEGGISQSKLYIHEKRKWGKKAGETTKRKYGIAHYKRISKLGAGKNKPNPDKVRELYGEDFFVRMGKIGMKKMIKLYKHKKHEWGVKSVEKSPASEQEIRIFKMFGKYGLNPELHKTITQNKVIGNFDFFFEDLNLIVETMNYSYKDESLAKILFKISLFRKLKNYKIIFILPTDSPVENILALLNNKIVPIFDANKNITKLAEEIKAKSIDFDEWKKITTFQMNEYLQKTKSQRENGFIARKNQKLNENEKKVEYALNQLGMKFSSHFVLNGPYNLKRVADFFCENNGKKFILEVTSSKNFEYCAKRLLGKFFAYKEFYKPEAKLMGIIFCPNISENLFETNFFVKKLLKISDKVVLNDIDQIKGVLYD